MFDIAVLPGDGVGPEVVAEALKALRVVGQRFGHEFRFREGLIGGISIDASGEALTAATLRMCRQCHAVLLGAVGGPKWDDPLNKVRPEDGLLDLRKKLALFANLRPVKVLPMLVDSTSLKPEVIQGVDMMGVGSDDLIPVMLEEKVPVINYSLGRPPMIAALVEAVHSYKGAVIGTVAMVRHAVRAEQTGVDMLVITGYEAAAHAGSVGALVLLPSVTDAVKIPCVGAGGYCDGRSLVAALALGAEGIAMGTRLAATQEAEVNDTVRQAWLKATEEDTIIDPAGYPVGSLAGVSHQPGNHPAEDRANKVAHQGDEGRGEAPGQSSPAIAEVVSEGLMLISQQLLRLRRIVEIQVVRLPGKLGIRWDGQSHQPQDASHHVPVEHSSLGSTADNERFPPGRLEPEHRIHQRPAGLLGVAELHPGFQRNTI